ncbi:MAG: hypothetical protein F2836_01460, partial [Actinobacteria bacterium]|nr:hypothetical protein [Actinomycetota bacterium]
MPVSDLLHRIHGECAQVLHRRFIGLCPVQLGTLLVGDSRRCHTGTLANVPDTVARAPRCDRDHSPGSEYAASVTVVADPRVHPRGSKLRAHVALTKPRIIELLLVTAVPTMFLAAGGLPSFRITVAVLIGGALSAGGANTLNSVYDRDIDALMHRTESRPAAVGS